MFQIGDKVICVNDYKNPETREELSIDMPNWVKKGEKYSVRGFLDSDFVVGVYLEGIENPVKYFKLINKVAEGAFATWRFKKLIEDEILVEEETELKELCNTKN